MFITFTKQSIPHDAERASHTGKVYGRINFFSGILQFAILPYLLGRRRRRQQQQQYHPDRGDLTPNHPTTNGHHSTDELPPWKHGIIISVDWYWLLLPTVLGIAGIVMILVVEPTPSLDLVVSRASSTMIGTENLFDVITVSYSIMKILEYSLRVALMERVRCMTETSTTNQLNVMLFFFTSQKMDSIYHVVF
jgi:hypothetical protein